MTKAEMVDQIAIAAGLTKKVAAAVASAACTHFGGRPWPAQVSDGLPFLLGLPGRGRWLRKFLSGLIAALLALAAYGFLVAYLPDTERPHFLLAVTAALLLISLRTLLRAFLLLRQRGRAASPP